MFRFSKSTSRTSRTKRMGSHSNQRRCIVEPLELRRLLTGIIPNDPDFPMQWALHNTGQEGGIFDADLDAPEAWEITTGSMETVVALLDTGVDYTHPDLYLNIWLNEAEIPNSIGDNLSDIDGDGIISFRDLNSPANATHTTDLNGNGYIDGGDLLADPNWEDGWDEDDNGRIDDLIGWDFRDGDNDPQEEDGDGHGTRLSLTVGAMANNGIGGAGINWDIRIMPVRIRSSHQEIVYSQVAAGLDYGTESEAPIVAAGFRQNPIDTADEFSQEIFDAIDRSRQAGKLVVAAAGNGARDTDTHPWYPQSYEIDNIITSGALSGTGDQLSLSSKTNWGATTVDYAVSTHRGTTSDAGAHAIGVAALVKSAYPDWTYPQLKAQILGTVDPMPSLVGKTVTGGRLNAAAALADSSIHISDPSIVEGNAGSTDLVFTITRRGDVSQGVTIDWATADGTALAGSDYVAAANTLVFQANESSKTISVNINGDLLDESDETLFLNLTNPSSGLLADTSGQGTIANDDAALPEISISDATATEGDFATAESAGAFVSAGSGGLDRPRGIIFGPDGNLYVTSVETDSVLRYDGETGAFLDEFVSPGSGGLDAPRDVLFDPHGQLLVASGKNERIIRYNGADGSFDTVLVDGTGGLDNPQNITYVDTTDELFVSSAESDEILKYDGQTGEFLGAFVTAGSGGLSNSKWHLFTEAGDLLVVSQLGDEILKYSSSGAFEEVFYAVPDQNAATTILMGMTWGADGNLLVAEDNDLNTGRVIRLNANTGAFIGEYVPIGSGGLDSPRSMTTDADGNLYVVSYNTDVVLRYAPGANVAFTVSVSAPSAAPVSVDYATSDNSATGGSDYQAASGTLVFEPGVSSRTIIVPTIDDAIGEEAETFTVNLNNATGGATIADGLGEATILDQGDTFFDFGDAPLAGQSGLANDYPTLIADDGARHEATGPMLGASRDTESDGQPTELADGDDTNDLADEDGIVDASAFWPGMANAWVDVVASEASYVNAWLDFNANGTWEPGEQVATDLPLVAGTNHVTFSIPMTAALGPTYARLRLTSYDTGGVMEPTGAADDGEVEDYVLVIENDVYLQATEEDDVISVWPGVAGSSLHRVEINGAVTTYDPALYDAIYIDALGGDDRVNLYGLDNSDDAFYAMGDSSRMEVGTTFAAWIDHCETNYGYAGTAATVGGDKAYLAGTAFNDTFVASDGSSYVTGGGYLHATRQFDTVEADVTGSGGSDKAYFNDTVGDDDYYGQPTEAWIELSSGVTNRAIGFPYTRATSSGSGPVGDRAFLTGADGQDKFIARFDIGYMFGTGYLNSSAGFDYVEADVSGTTGEDWAYFAGTAGDDTYYGAVDESRMELSNGVVNKSIGFPNHYALAEGEATRDVAYLSGSAGDDVFVAGDGYAYTYGSGVLNSTRNFETVEADVTADGHDSAALHGTAGVDRFYGGLSESRIELSTGVVNKAFGAFDTVYAYGTSGDGDEAYLAGTAGDDTFVGRDGSAYIAGSGKVNSLRQFDYVEADVTGSGGTDTATLYDSSIIDLFTVDGDEASFDHGNDGDLELLARSFSRVNAYSTEGGPDKKDDDQAYNFPLMYYGSEWE